MWAWGTYRDTTGVYGFSPQSRFALLPTLVWDPKKADDQAVKIASGKRVVRLCATIVWWPPLYLG